MPKTLSDKRKNKCQQCQNEHAKGHEVLEIKVLHKHYPHSQQIRLSDPNGREYAFTVDKNEKFLQRRTYRIYFLNSLGLDGSMQFYQNFLGFEELAETE